ncbi:hypothetical protein [Methylobacterium nodulans]|uniref:Uncharacterized protein n=1 Tax=Methylobacterium nodulans (strain LMG 21967 / CNCM I-2342 / ORS 2060) TaxID=460265 RepID=B8IWK3_METNO|nr:hypothetical protein [Methylobacterium nodulans]ACL62793.1 conserved hypothetical protein [Methylobacterium nodulans ORS 2060]
MPDHPTISTLIVRNVVTFDQLDAAVEAYLSDPTSGPREIGNGVTIDIAAAVQAYSTAKGLAAEQSFEESTRRLLVRTSMLLARPT